MRKTRWGLTLPLGLILFAALACKFGASTANISELKLGKDKGVSAETSSFGEGDTVFAVATVSNAPDKLKVKGRLVVEDVAGEQAGPIPGLEKTLDLSGSGTATFTFSPPASGWPKGKYKLEVLMLNEDGEQKDQKSASFTVS
ncbi:MAG: hypothetical protein QOJ70_3269 [Acidobacteriota bacterium]|jgi:hypothetical protein|nr:hypothetical protein [Acidobacteriota bacterium]